MSQTSDGLTSQEGSGTTIGWKECEHCHSHVANMVVRASDGLHYMRLGRILRLVSDELELEYRVLDNSYVYSRQRLAGLNWQRWGPHADCKPFYENDEAVGRAGGIVREYEVVR